MAVKHLNNLAFKPLPACIQKGPGRQTRKDKNWVDLNLAGKTSDKNHWKEMAQRR